MLGFDDMIVPFFRWCSLIKRLVKNTKRVKAVLTTLLFGRWLDLLGDESSSEHHQEYQQSKTDYSTLDECADLSTREHLMFPFSPIIGHVNPAPVKKRKLCVNRISS